MPVHRTLYAGKTLSLLGIALTLILWGESSVAAFSEAAGARFDERQQYRQAIDALRQGRRSEAHRLSAQLTDYPLFPYLEYYRLVYSMNHQTPQEINAFVTQYADTPLVGPLQRSWLTSLARRGRWQTFADHYDADIASTTLTCRYAQSLYQTSQIEKAHEVAERLWLKGSSQPDECDEPFKKLRDRDDFEELAWKRVVLAMAVPNTSLATYLNRFLSDRDRQLATLLRQIHRRSTLVVGHKKLTVDDKRSREIIQHGIKRLARQNGTDALDALNHYSHYQFTQDELNSLYEQIARQLIVQRDPNNTIPLLPFDISGDADLQSRLIRLSLFRLDWNAVIGGIDALPMEMQSTPRWQFWRARAPTSREGLRHGAEDIGQPGIEGHIEQNRQEAHRLLVRLAVQRDFYGFRAADLLSSEYNFADVPGDISRDQLLSLEATPGIQRAFELLALGEISHARREWHSMTTQFSTREKEIAARVAAKWGWHHQAIRSAVDARSWDALAIRYPIAFEDDFLSNARRWDIPVTLSLSVARQESMFMSDARSPAGALGVMQVMPATARLTARRFGVSHKHQDQLLDANHNINLGSAYLGMMLRRFDNNRIVASAAYNAGPGRADRWIKHQLPVDVWIETIPFTETRNYVQRVLMGAAIYSRHIGEPQPLIYEHELGLFSEGQPPQLADSDDQNPDATTL